MRTRPRSLSCFLSAVLIGLNVLLFQMFTQTPEASKLKPERVELKDEECKCFPEIESPLRKKTEGKRPAHLKNTHVAIVITVHNALDYLKECLRSIEAHSSKYILILVDDHSSNSTKNFILNYKATYPEVVTVISGLPLAAGMKSAGYTISVNTGIAAALRHDYPWSSLILLNSDTIVTPFWLEKMLDTANSADSIGMVGPLTNAGSWQSIPDIKNSKGGWSVNTFPPGWSPDMVATALDWVDSLRPPVPRDVQRGMDVSTFRSSKLQIVNDVYPRVRLLNGFCLLIKRSVIRTVGCMNEKLFPFGFGEENDYALRVHEAGYELVLATDAYVFHAKSKSYGAETRDVLSKDMNGVLSHKWGNTLTLASVVTASDKSLGYIRKHMSRVLMRPPGIFDPRDHHPDFGDYFESALFLLPPRTKATGGGIISIVELAFALMKRGIFTQCAVTPSVDVENKFASAFPEEYLKGLFVGYEAPDRIGKISKLSQRFQFIVATHFQTVEWMKNIIAVNRLVNPAYFVQDYEPWFYKATDTSGQRQIALSSYSLINNQLIFAKTNWLKTIVEKNHGVTVAKIEPSVNGFRWDRHNITLPIRIAAMLRPRTPRRGATMTLAVMKQLKSMFGDIVMINFFGCQSEDITSHGLSDLANFDFKLHGVLNRAEMGELLQSVDIFADFSTWQAFGRTGLESMSAGCVPIMPKLGGAIDYCTHGISCLLVDSTDQNSCVNTIRSIIVDQSRLQRLKKEALSVSRNFGVGRAVESIVRVFNENLRDKQRYIEKSHV